METCQLEARGLTGGDLATAPDSLPNPGDAWKARAKSYTAGISSHRGVRGLGQTPQQLSQSPWFPLPQLLPVPTLAEEQEGWGREGRFGEDSGWRPSAQALLFPPAQAPRGTEKRTLRRAYRPREQGAQGRGTACEGDAARREPSANLS